MKNKRHKRNKKSLNQRKKINQKQFEKALKGYNSLKLNLFLSFFWIVMLFIFSLILSLINKRNYLDNLSASSIMSFCISIMWILIRIGIGEKLMLFFRNRRIKQVGRLHHQHVINIKIEEYRKIRQERPWIGIWIYFAFALFMVLLTLLLVFAF